MELCSFSICECRDQVLQCGITAHEQLIHIFNKKKHVACNSVNCIVIDSEIWIHFTNGLSMLSFAMWVDRIALKCN